MKSKKMFRPEVEALTQIVETSSFYKFIKVLDRETEETYEHVFYFSVNENKESVWCYNHYTTYDGGFFENEEDSKENLTKEEVEDMILSLVLVSSDTKVLVSPLGTHCGSLEFCFGWVHTAKTEDIEEAVMPQMNFNKKEEIEEDFDYEGSDLLCPDQGNDNLY